MNALAVFYLIIGVFIAFLPLAMGPPRRPKPKHPRFPPHVLAEIKRRHREMERGRRPL